MPRKGVASAVLFASAFLTVAFAQSPIDRQAAQDILRKVDDRYDTIRSLKTGYTEHFTGLGMDRMESGTLLLKKPGRMRWDYSKPAGKVFILDGRFAWFYTPGDMQASRISAKKLDDLRSPLRFLLGHTQLKKELDNLVVVRESLGFSITGVPKGMAQRVKALSLDVTPQGLIRQMRIEEKDGSTTEFTFVAMQEGVPVSDSDFIFQPPAGVAIVDGLPPI